MQLPDHAVSLKYSGVVDDIAYYGLACTLIGLKLNQGSGIITP